MELTKVQKKYIYNQAKEIAHIPNPADEVESIVRCIQEFFVKNAPGHKAIIGISGGKDSTVAAALCVRALGRDHVIGVLMPNGEQSDIADSYRVCDYLGIQHLFVDIGETVNNLYKSIDYEACCGNSTVLTNTPSRIRMATLYAVSALCNGRVICTCNKSESYIGWSTKWGDVGDYAPLANLTVSDIYVLGVEMGIPEDLLFKPPADGMSGRTDEANFGFTYAELDDFLINNKVSSIETMEKIYERNIRNLHKRHASTPSPYSPCRDTEEIYF